MRTRFENQLEDLKKDIQLMGQLCLDIFSNIDTYLNQMKAIEIGDIWLHYQRIEELERNIEKRCIQLLLRQQPVARDLRFISASLKMVYDIKRIGIQSSEIMELLVKEDIRNITLVEIHRMLAHNLEMVKESLQSFIEKEVCLAETIVTKDDVVDQYFVIIKEKLAEFLVQNQHSADQVLNLLMIAKYLEKIGDHSVNIAKWVMYAYVG